ncbi:MAG: YbaK/EbsC family protein [Patescibacteria group bacterium]
MWYETFEHEPVRTSEEAARIRPGYTLAQGAKAILVRVKENGGKQYFVLIVLPGNQRFDNKKVKDIFSAKDVRFATEDEVREITGGIEPGGVPPFGNLFSLRVIVDPAVFFNEKIVFNAGDKRHSIAMKSDDYRKLVNPEVVTVV